MWDSSTSGNLIASSDTPTFGATGGTGDSRVRIPVVAGQTYYIRVIGANGVVVNGYDMTIVNEAPPVPENLELVDSPIGDTLNSDTGRSEYDNVTRDNTPTIVLRLDDAIFLHDLPGNASDDTPPAGVITIPFQTDLLTAGYAIAICDEGSSGTQVGTAPQEPVGYAVATAQEGVYTYTFTTALADGSHFLTARVVMIDPANPTEWGYGDRSVALEIVVDTVVPPIYFGVATIVDDGLDASSDTGVLGEPTTPVDTFTDRVTSDTTPTFFGTAEADSIIRLYVDINGDEVLDAGDRLLAETVATPTDGTNQNPDGRWTATSNVNLNDSSLGLGVDGTRRIFVTAEDVAGNVSEAQTLLIFVDTAGPQVTDVEITGSTYDLFGNKLEDYTATSPTPLVYSLTITVQDMPNRDTTNFPDDVALALVTALEAGNYQVVGDANGIIAIDTITVTNDPLVDGEPATATIVLTFVEPLPDDRFTLTISDSLVDLAGNALDGESGASEPDDDPDFPSGDGVPGGDFVARFTVDSRPEIGTWAAGSVYVDINGNFSYDPDNLDISNRDFAYIMGYTSDDVFCGNFVADAVATADGFDKLAAYGKDMTGHYRWVIDTDNDGVGDLKQYDPEEVNGLPVSGDFDGNPDNGDEVGVFDGTTWYLDTDHDFMVDTPIATALRGYPITGDFDGDGYTDLATYTKGWFYFDLTNGVDGSWDGVVDDRFRTPFLTFIGTNERPVAADMNQDGVTDIGLWVPDRSGVDDNMGEWYFFVSDEAAGDDDNYGTVNAIYQEFSIYPLGNDIFAQFGDEFALPIVGNFDPPVSGGSGTASEPLVLSGTSGNDVLIVSPGEEAGTWTVSLNGEEQTVSGDSFSLSFDGLEGKDEVTITGTGAGGDQVDLGPDQVSVVGTGYVIQVTNAEVVSVVTSGEGNSAVFHDTTAADLFTASPGSAFLVGGGISLSVLGASSVSAESGAGGNDTANLSGSSGDDMFVGALGESSLQGTGFSLNVLNFRYVYANALAGDGDSAQLYGTDGNESLVATALAATLSGSDYLVRAKGFDKVEAFGQSGDDIARLTGSTGGDTLIAKPTSARMWSRGFDVEESGFEHLLAYSGGGADLAFLYDSAGNDTLTGSYKETRLAGSDYDMRVSQFMYVYAYSSTGLDVAFLNDSPGDDLFCATSTAARLSGPNYGIWTRLFDVVYAYATDGQDTAKLYGSAGADVFAARSSYAQMLGSGYFYRVRSFEVVCAYGEGGDDTATLYDTVLEGPLTDAAIGTLPDSCSRVAWLSNFMEIREKKEGVTVQTLEAVDEVFAAYW